MRLLSVVTVAVVLVGLAGCRACTEQHDPTPDWKKFSHESSNANKPSPKLTDDGKLPAGGAAETVALSPIDEKYQNFCASCHGATGKGDGPAGGALNPKPRNFVDWTGADADSDEHITKVIRDGGVAVGKSPMMAPWGGVLGDQGVIDMVAKVKSFRKK